MINNITTIEEGILTVFDTVSFALIIVNPAGKIININEAGCQIVGKKKSNLLGLYIGECFDCVNSHNSFNATCGMRNDCSQCKIRNAFSQTFKSNEPCTQVVCTLKRDVNNEIEQIVLSISTSILSIRDFNYVLISAVDITEKFNVETELVKLKSKMSKGETLRADFFKNVSHETRTQLNNIIGFAELLTKMTIEQEQEKNYIENILKQSNQLNILLTDVLIIAKLLLKQDVIKKEIFNLNEFIETCLATYIENAEIKNIELKSKIELPNHDSFIETDSEKLEKIFEYLIRNSIKYTTSGSIRFGYKISPSKMLHFFVKDTGSGIPKELQEAVFDPYVQLKSGYESSFNASGLGLAISKKYVELLGGEIWIESEPEKGTTINFMLPYIKVVSSQNYYHDQQPTSKFRVSNNTILIAEDDSNSYSILESMLADIGARIIWARNGALAVKYCKLSSEINLVLMDLKMPTMDGFEATKLIRKFNVDVPIIALSAYSSHDDLQNAKLAGCNGFITKPVTLHRLFETLKKYINTID